MESCRVLPELIFLPLSDGELEGLGYGMLCHDWELNWNTLSFVETSFKGGKVERGVLLVTDCSNHRSILVRSGWSWDAFRSKGI